MKRNKTCPRCQGPMDKKMVEHPYWHGPTLVALVQDVPSWVCQMCGHHYFDPTVETTLNIIVKDYVKIGRLFPIPSTPYREMPVGKN
jgi:YgiT-type zinc finger domain-containing protein